MEGAGDRQHHRAPHALGLGDLDGPLDRGPVAGDHDLSAAIVVGGLHHLALRSLGGDRGGLIEIDTEERRHGADADRHRLLHGTAADAHQPHRIGQRKRAGRRQRGIFADRMAGDELRVARQIHAGFGFQDPHGRQRDRDQGRLRVLGEHHPFRRPLPHDGAEPVAERRVDLVEHLPGRGKGLGERLAHADGLAALPRKHERDRHFPPFREVAP